MKWWVKSSSERANHSHFCSWYLTYKVYTQWAADVTEVVAAAQHNTLLHVTALWLPGGEHWATCPYPCSGDDDLPCSLTHPRALLDMVSKAKKEVASEIFWNIWNTLLVFSPIKPFKHGERHIDSSFIVEEKWYNFSKHLKRYTIAN